MTSDCNNENKNDQALHCQHCNSLILRQNLGEYVKQQVSASINLLSFVFDEIELPLRPIVAYVTPYPSKEFKAGRGDRVREFGGVLAGG